MTGCARAFAKEDLRTNQRIPVNRKADCGRSQPLDERDELGLFRLGQVERRHCPCYAVRDHFRKLTTRRPIWFGLNDVRAKFTAIPICPVTRRATSSKHLLARS